MDFDNCMTQKYPTEEFTVLKVSCSLATHPCPFHLYFYRSYFSMENHSTVFLLQVVLSLPTIL